MSQLYYSAKEAREILGMTHSALLNQVTAGNLQRIIPPGRRQGVYLKEEVDNLKKELDLFFKTRQATDFEIPQFVKATVDDMEEGVALADAVFGGLRTISVDTRIGWLKKNPDIDYFVKQEGRIVGYLSLVPLRPKTIDDLLMAKRFARELSPDDILPYIPGKTVDIYAMAIGVMPGVSFSQKRDWGAALIKGGIDVIVGLGKRGIVIKTIQAHSTTPDGIRLMRHFGFSETPAKIPNMRDFKINVAESGIPYIMEYKAELKKWKEAQVARVPSA
jgi:hypothetical protein